MRVAETQVFPFAELSDDAKEKAREWWRDVGLDYKWWDFVYDDAVRIAKILGIKIGARKTNNPKAQCEPTIWFRRFWSQGDGACFEGTYAYAPGWKKALAAHAPKDEELRRIGQVLQDTQKQYGYSLSASVVQSGYYNHSGYTRISVETDTEKDLSAGDEEDVAQCLRDFMDWIYGNLEREHEWLMSDEAVDDTIVANEYEFRANGTVW